MKTMKTDRKNQKGFTLIELLVTIGILGILAAVVVPNVGRFVGSGAQQAAATELTSVQTAMDSAMAELGLRAGDVVAATTPVTDFTATKFYTLGTTDYFLASTYLRINKTGGKNISYEWDANGLVKQCDLAGANCSPTSAYGGAGRTW